MPDVPRPLRNIDLAVLHRCLSSIVIHFLGARGLTKNMSRTAVEIER